MSIAWTGQAPGGERTVVGRFADYRRRASARLPKRSRQGPVIRAARAVRELDLSKCVDIVDSPGVCTPSREWKGNVRAKLGMEAGGISRGSQRPCKLMLC